MHYTRGADGLPVPTELAATELQPTYIFLVDPPLSETSTCRIPGYVKAASEWKANASQYLAEPLFYAQQIVEPTQFR